MDDLTKTDVKAIRLLRSYLPEITRNIHDIPWWQPWLWKYRKGKVKVLGLKKSIEVVLEIKKIYLKLGKEND